MGSNATWTFFCSTLRSLGCLNSRIFRCISSSRLSKSRGNFTKIRGVEYFILMVDPSGLTRVTGYTRVNTFRLIFVTADRLAFRFLRCSPNTRELKEKIMFDKILVFSHDSRKLRLKVILFECNWYWFFKSLNVEICLVDWLARLESI